MSLLDELSVTNLGIIARAHVAPGAGLVAVTGETGAGKTMLLGALRLLVGDTARTDLIGPEGDESVVEGRFLIGEEELVVARRVGAGRSRAYLDGSMVSARAIGDRLAPHVEIVGQHDQLALTKPIEVRRLVDRRLQETRVRDAYTEVWARVTELRHSQQQLGGDRRALERERDLVGFQVAEIDAAGFAVGDETELEVQAARLGNAEQIAGHAAEAHRALDDARRSVGDAVAALRKAADLDSSQRALTDRVEGLDGELSDASAETRRTAEEVESDPAMLEHVDQRLTLLGELRRKYGDDLVEIGQFRDQAAARHEELTELLERAQTVDTDLAEAEAALDVAGRELRDARDAAAAILADEAVVHLVELGISDPVLTIAVESADPGPEGADTLTILFASDRRLEPGPVAKVASGGELSRLVLSLRLASGASSAGIIAFDEIDTGVGGATALALGAKLAGLAEDRQVLCVTHLPQVAAFADTHLVVDRDTAGATVRVVSGDARVEELSRMLSGLPESERGREHAEELRARALQQRT